MKKNCLKALTMLLFTISLGALPAQKSIESIDMATFVDETQVSNSVEEGVEIVWWIPNELWQIAFANDKSMTQEQKEEFTQLLSPYSLVAVLDGDFEANGGIIYESELKTRDRIQIRMDNGEVLYPLESTDIPLSVQGILHSLKPLLSGMMGQMGENMHFFVFSDLDRKRNRQLDPLDAEKSFSVFMTEEFDVRFDLPLSSLLENKTCPVDGTTHDGTWNYCPYHGVELE